MTASLFDTIGRKQVEIETLNANYDFVLGTLAGVISGKVAASRVLVNLTDRSMTVSPEGQSPGLPAVINGLPVVVVAPPAPEAAPDAAAMALQAADMIAPIVAQRNQAVNLLTRMMNTPIIQQAVPAAAADEVTAFLKTLNPPE